MTLRSFPSVASLNAAVASTLSDIASNAIASRGRFTIALSGGNTPRSLYELLAREYSTAIDWKHIQIFWGDERNVPHDDLDSNYRMAKESLIDHIDIPLENIHAVPILMSETAEAVAIRYASVLQDIFGQGIPEFDLILLGLGNDGHTASLFPGMSEQEMNNGLVIATHSPVKPFDRISLTLLVINKARNVFFLVLGSDKATILQQVLADRENAKSQFPASMVHPRGDLLWFVDEAAMGND
jgi:6-phosphogluconolactonase